MYEKKQKKKKFNPIDELGQHGIYNKNLADGLQANYERGTGQK